MQNHLSWQIFGLLKAEVALLPPNIDRNPKNQTKTFEVFDFSERSLMRWLGKYKETSQIKRKSRIYVSYKVKQIHVNYMKKIINKNKTITMKDLLQKLKDKYKDVDYTEMQVYRVIKDNNITLKQTKLRYVPKTRFRKPIEAILQRSYQQTEGIATSWKNIN